MAQHRTDESGNPPPPEAHPPRRGTRLSRALAAVGVVVAVAWGVVIAVAAAKHGNAGILLGVTLVPQQLILAMLAYAARDRAIVAGLTLLATLCLGGMSWSIVGPEAVQFACLSIPIMWVGVAMMFPASRIRRVW